MSNLVAFYNVVHRAQTKSDNAVSLLENVPITTNASIILFAAKHIEMMEEQQARMQRELDELRSLLAVSDLGKHPILMKGVEILTGNHIVIKGNISVQS